VENSVTHGLSRRRTPGSIVVEIQREGARLRLTISDNGGGEASTGRGHGIGLGNTAERLRFLYGDEQSIEVRHTAGGTTVSLAIPARTSPTL
jgi:LytS/YehU family sensor histidine kinase